MRIVRHPNIVELKAFYYSNGDRVCAGPPVVKSRSVG
jgi:glycogen synthase kinase 3 beta